MDKLKTIEIQAQTKLRTKLMQIGFKYLKLADETSEKIEAKKKREQAKALRVVNNRVANQKRKLKWKPAKQKEINHMTKADWYFSRCVRSIGAFQLSDWERYNTEYTWTAHFRLKELTCWHYKTRWIYVTRYHMGNCLPQTAGQNKAEHKNPALKEIFRKRLIVKHWLFVVEEVERLAQERKQSDNKKMDFEYEHNFWKNEYETKYKHMRE